MIAVDTNVLVRYFAQDDPVQSRKATHFIERRISQESPAFVSTVVLTELVWSLKRLYRANRQETARVLNVLLGSRAFVIEHRAEVATAAAAFKDHGFDFADILIHLIGLSRDCEGTCTFDERALAYPGFRTL